MTFFGDKPLHDWSAYPMKFNIKYKTIMNYELAKKPTLSDLVEVCGTDFSELCQLGEGGEFQWYATMRDENRYYGHTPEEAVAKAWLKLHE